MEFLNQLDINNSKVTEVATPTSGTDATNKTYVDTALALKAPIASPTFTGTVTAPTFSGNASTATGIKGSDTRYNNKAPSSYMGLGADMYLAPTYSRSEFKSISTMGLGSYLTGSFCYVMTHVPWEDISGGVPVQFAYGAGVPCYRIAASGTAWGTWTPINNGGNADQLDGQHGSYYAPVASPTFTGTVTGNFTETQQALGTISTATTINCASGSIVTATLGAAISIGITASASASTCRVCTLLLTNGGAYTITWNSAIKWAGGTAPTLTASGVDIITFLTVDNGATWRGALNGADFK